MWWYVATFIVSLVLAASMRPKSQSQPASGLNDVQAPTADEGLPVPVLFGTRVIEGPNCVWYGDLRSEPIKK